MSCSEQISAPGRITVDPVVRIENVYEAAPGVLVIPDGRTPLVPNIGVISGPDGVLVVDTGLGPENAARVREFALDQAKGRPLYLTTTHFHPEHAFGAGEFADAATFLVNRAQAADLVEKGPGYLQMFRTLGAPVARRLAGHRPAVPDLVYEDAYDLDLGGGRTVRLRATGRAHSRGDQVITVPDAGVMFTGDLVEAGRFALFPWFPPHDTDASGTGWLAVLRQLAAVGSRVVVPGHGGVGGPQLLTDVRDYLQLLRDETWSRRSSGLGDEAVAEEVRALVLARHPEWEGREWITSGVACLCAEHAAGAEQADHAAGAEAAEHTTGAEAAEHAAGAEPAG